MRYVEDIYVQIFPGASRDVSLTAMCRRDQIRSRLLEPQFGWRSKLFFL